MAKGPKKLPTEPAPGMEPLSTREFHEAQLESSRPSYLNYLREYLRLGPTQALHSRHSQRSHAKNLADYARANYNGRLTLVDTTALIRGEFEAIADQTVVAISEHSQDSWPASERTTPLEQFDDTYWKSTFWDRFSDRFAQNAQGNMADMFEAHLASELDIFAEHLDAYRASDEFASILQEAGR